MNTPQSTLPTQCDERVAANLREQEDTTVEMLRDALQHIAKTAALSRTSTRRLRWIEERAKLALKGKPYVESDLDLPRHNLSSYERYRNDSRMLDWLLPNLHPANFGLAYDADALAADHGIEWRRAITAEIRDAQRPQREKDGAA